MWVVKRKEYIPCPDPDMPYQCGVVHTKEYEDEFRTYEDASLFCVGKMRDHLIEIKIVEK